ncbi:alpha/beta hydrolase, partial [Pseudomonas aeruginosa]|nr:alpha/beta hydrolase [Pseudomonas aeruginosa]
MKTSMPRALLALICLLASLAHAAPNSILHRPYDLDTGHGVLRGSLLLPRSAVAPPGGGGGARTGAHPPAGSPP